ncbi:unnamed protein product [Camellia sinensis]
MILHITTSFTSPFQATTTITKYYYLKNLNLNSTSADPALVSKTLFPNNNNNHGRGSGMCLGRRSGLPNTRRGGGVHASLLETPLLWAGRLCIFYALLKAGLAGSPSNPLVSVSVSDLEAGSDDLGFSKWIEEIQGNPDKQAADRRKLVSKWHPTTKGTLKRNYRVPSKSEGRHLLKSIASLLSDDDKFRDATSHKGCQIRRESAHGESVCCNNVRALFDELPTPHLVVEITPFPAGPLTENDYDKAEKLERVLRSGPCV